jgi:hypothetical protein
MSRQGSCVESIDQYSVNVHKTCDEIRRSGIECSQDETLGGEKGMNKGKWI